jgi:murein DD-endopeptidase MepM/ murein hydrolase activator NlpD
VHEATDIIADKMTPVIAVANGEIVLMPIPEASWGYGIFMRGDDGYKYNYIHINNDTPGTDDGNGGPEHAYAPGLQRGSRVTRGQLIGWVGDSGNAEAIASHLHFEIIAPDGTPVNPYWTLLAIEEHGRFDPDAETQSSITISGDKGLVPSSGSLPCVAETLVKSPEKTALYYCGVDGKRYVFPNERIYKSWYANFDRVAVISAEALGNIPIGGNVTYRPGTQLVKVASDPKVYAVAHGGVLRWVQSPEIAASLYGTTWSARVHDLSDAFFVNYLVGAPISASM